MDWIEPDSPYNSTLVLNDANGIAITPSSQAPTPCSWMCMGSTRTFGWKRQTLATHPQPLTLVIVTPDQAITYKTVKPWTAYTVYGVDAISQGYPLNSAWYQTDMAHALLLAIPIWTIVKYLLYLGILQRRSASRMTLTFTNAILLPITCFFSYHFGGYFAAIPMVIGMIIFESIRLKQLNENKGPATSLALLANVVGFIIAAVIGAQVGDMYGFIPVF